MDKITPAYTRTRIKICCISSLEEAREAAAAGADAIGLVSAMPSGPGIISEELAREIAQQAPPAITTFLLTSLQNGHDIVTQLRHTGAQTIQIVDSVPAETYAMIREALPYVKIVQVIHVVNETSIVDAIAAAPYADALLLDSGNPQLAVKELGGTGRVHNWEISYRICQSVSIPIWLAGGLNPENVQNAIATVQPFGVDLCSGVRTNGRLDTEKLKRFVKAAGEAWLEA